MTKIDAQTFWKMVGMREAGLGDTRIAELVNVSVRAVSSNFAKGPLENRRRKARKTTPAVAKRRRLLKQLLTKKVIVEENVGPTLNNDGQIRKNSRNPRSQTRFPTGSLTRARRALYLRHNIEKSRATLQRDRVATGLLCRKRPKGPERYRGDEAKRLKYAKTTLPFATEYVDDTYFVDEKMFDSVDSDVFCYVPPGVAPPARERSRFPPRVHVFGCVGVGFRFLYIFKTNEKVDSEAYRVKCLEPLLRMRNGLRKKYFVHDGAGPHKGVREWLAGKTLGVLDHPARSPDMNPIERVWSHLQQLVSAYGPMVDEQLRAFVRKCWDEVSQESIDKTCRAWPKQLKAVITNKGATSSKH